MAVVTVESGSASFSEATAVAGEVYSATSDDVFIITTSNGQSFKIVGYDDAGGGENFAVGAPAGQDYVNIRGWAFPSGATFSVADMAGNVVYTVVNDGSYADGCFRIVLDGSGNLTVLQDAGDDGWDMNWGTGEFWQGFDQQVQLFSGPICFLPGTRIATPHGERAIETLAIGDAVTTADGASQPIKWIGRMTLPLNRYTRATATPVCVKAGALGSGLPQRDLYVSVDHALLVDGLLVQAAALIDGVNVIRCSDWAGDAIEYFHIELDHHAVIVAEGAASESLWADEAIRAKFDNAAEFAARYPQHETTPALDLPRVKFARQVPMAIRRRLGAVAAA